MENGTKVRSRYSLYKGDIGVISGSVPIYDLKEDIEIGKWVHVIFPANDIHHTYQQSFNSKDLQIVD